MVCYSDGVEEAFVCAKSCTVPSPTKLWLPMHSLDWHILLSVHYCSASTLVPCIYTMASTATASTQSPQPPLPILYLYPVSPWLLIPPPLPSLLPCQHVTLSAYRDATSRANQSSKARSEAQLKHVALGDEEIFQLFWRRFSHVCLKVPTADNFYLSWYMRGAGYCNLAQRQDFYPPYLREESFQRLKVSVCGMTASVIRLSALLKEQ